MAYRKEGDTKPIRAKLKNLGGVPINLGLPPNEAAVTLLASPKTSGVGRGLAGTCVIEDGPNGEVAFVPAASDLPASVYRVDFVIDWPDGSSETVPNRDYEELIVQQR